MGTVTSMRFLALVLWVSTVLLLLGGWAYGSRSAAGAGSTMLVLYLILAARTRSLDLSSKRG
jgi:hypothetical protein